MRKLGKWAVNVLIGIDQLANAVACGDPDETISSRIGKIKVEHGGSIPWSHPLVKIIDWGLDKLDPGHSVDAIEDDEGDDAVLQRRMRRVQRGTLP